MHYAPIRAITEEEINMALERFEAAVKAKTN